MRRVHDPEALSTFRFQEDVGKGDAWVPGVQKCLRPISLGVVLRVRVTGLDVRDRVARVGLRTGVLRLGPLFEARGDRHRASVTGVQTYALPLYQGETLLVLDALAELVQHVNPPGSVWA